MLELCIQMELDHLVADIVAGLTNFASDNPTSLRVEWMRGSGRFLVMLHLLAKSG